MARNINCQEGESAELYRMFDITDDTEPAKNLTVISRLDEAIPLVALLHVVEVARFMCVSLTYVPAKAALFSSFFSSSFSLFLSVSLSPPHCPSSHLSRLYPPRVPLLTPSYPVFSSRISSFFHAGPRVCVVQSPRKVFVWRFRRGPPFLLLQPQSQPHLSSHRRPLFPLNIRRDGLGMKSFGEFLKFLYVLIA